MKLSIIIPIYNGAPFLDKLIQTISAFTITDFECVFIDNNSTDNSVALLNKFLQSVPFDYSILKEEKQGAGFARNTGIKHAKGKYLAFLDCDDIIRPEKFEHDFNILAKHDVDFVFCRTKRFYQDGRALKHPTTAIKEGVNLPPSLGLAWLCNFFALQGTGSLLVKKSIVEKLQGFHSSLTGEDAFLFIRMGLLYKGYFYDKTYFHYFRHPDSTISKANKSENSALRRYFELRQHLYNDDIVKDNPIAMHILKEQLQTDILKLHRLGDNINTLKTEELQRLKLSAILFNPFSLFINRRIPHIKYNPFFQLDRKLLKRRRDKTLKKL